MRTSWVDIKEEKKIEIQFFPPPSGKSTRGARFVNKIKQKNRIGAPNTWK